MAACFFLLEAVKQKGGQHRETKDDCVAALPWEGVVPRN
jgi:hypothetical protein